MASLEAVEEAKRLEAQRSAALDEINRLAARWTEALDEAKRMEVEIVCYPGQITTVCMDSKADDQHLYFRLKKDHHIQLVTTPRKEFKLPITSEKSRRWKRKS